MEEEKLFSEMYQAAVELLEKRYPTGWGCASVLRAEDGRFFSSVYMDAISYSVQLCFETGAILEAHKYDVRCTHILSIKREDTDCDIELILPCGICQERLRFWGKEFQVAVERNGKREFMTLHELSPIHWTDGYDPAEISDYAYYHKEPMCREDPILEH